jgi:hypothetical protein
MRLLKVILKNLGNAADGSQIAGEVSGVISANVNEPGTSRTSVRSRHRIVQKGGRTVVSEHETESRREHSGKDS